MSHRTIASICSLLLPLCLLGSSCQSSGADQAEGTATSVSTLEQTLQAASAQITTTNSALQQILANPSGDLRPSFDVFKSAVSTLESRAKDVTKKSEEMKAKAQAYFADWDKNLATIQNEDIRERSMERRTELMERQAEANAKVDDLKKRFDAYVAQLHDVHAFLDHDLNTAGVEAIEDDAKEAIEAGEDVSEDVDKVAAKLAEVRAAISAQGANAPPPTP
jgi:hypothetical protein